MLSKIKEAIEKLGLERNELFGILESKCWRRNLSPQVKPARIEPTFGEFNLGTHYPEERSMPRDFIVKYQAWYSSARIIVSKNQNDRLAEFDELYVIKDKKSGFVTEGIRYFLDQTEINESQQMRIMDLIDLQYAILAAIPAHLEHSIFDIKFMTYAHLMDDELEVAQGLLKDGFIRASGVIAGVVLERHVKNLLDRQNPPIRYGSKDTLSRLNELAKDKAYDVIQWRKIQFLGDIRNKCAHAGDVEPTKEEVSEMLSSTQTLIKLLN